MDDLYLGCLNSAADAVPRRNMTWSDTNLTGGADVLYDEFDRLVCTCGGLEFQVLQTEPYETTAHCTACGKYYIVHSG
jgi:hypothetical protein